MPAVRHLVVDRAAIQPPEDEPRLIRGQKLKNLAKRAGAVRLDGCDRDHVELAPGLLGDFRPRVRLCEDVSNAMKIRVIIRCSTVTPEFVRHSMWNVFKQMSCRVAGHRSEIEVTSGRLALKCARCGWESPGWRIDPRGSSGMGMTSRARA